MVRLATRRSPTLGRNAVSGPEPVSDGAGRENIVILGVFPGLRCGRLLRLVVLARLKSEAKARTLAGAGPTAGRVTGWRR